jgi:UDP-glucuronate decarboxylase
MKLMDSPDGVTGPINIGNPSEFTIRELAEKVIVLTGSSSELIFKDLPEDDPKQRQPDISKAKDLLDWEPNIELEEGLGRTIVYFCDRLADLRVAGS